MTKLALPKATGNCWGRDMYDLHGCGSLLCMIYMDVVHSSLSLSPVEYLTTASTATHSLTAIFLLTEIKIKTVKKVPGKQAGRLCISIELVSKQQRWAHIHPKQYATDAYLEGSSGSKSWPSPCYRAAPWCPVWRSSLHLDLVIAVEQYTMSRWPRAEGIYKGSMEFTVWQTITNTGNGRDLQARKGLRNKRIYKTKQKTKQNGSVNWDV